MEVKIKVGDHFVLDGSDGHPVFRCVKVEKDGYGLDLVGGLARGSFSISWYYSDFCVKVDKE